ncbi:uncharacterized protein B0I36DRAFT_433183 [Microdochium trichocladiopsis]|uniref:DUF7702 domain-containing protein n=1 Tax=Microdochium trichocladiopsis TaxID=1682393 RepID=A0A9P8Y5L1_9PEZI|nr:uncharacterized protein B0I36DRAFT_433183 [Microdochium trichocladiopsis]KAH7028055.1 hypothetical protein B0I36DRAFT_433183 [Microdochium trichocladiopsis]
MFFPEYDLAIAELVIYIILLFVIGYVLLRHGRPGWDAWGFLAVFCILRIVAAGYQLSDQQGISTTGAIINAIGVSGLLLGCSGVVLECANCNPSNNPKITRMVGLIFHIAVVAGIVLAAIGASDSATALSKGQPPPSDARAKQVGGYVLLLLATAFLTLYTFFQLIRLRTADAAYTDHSGHGGSGSAVVFAKRLLYFVVLALPFIIVRVLYGLVAAASQDRSLSLFYGDFVVHLVLITIVQLIAVLFLVAGGLSSIGMYQVAPSRPSRRQQQQQQEQEQEPMRYGHEDNGLEMGSYGSSPMLRQHKGERRPRDQVRADRREQRGARREEKRARRH